MVSVRWAAPILLFVVALPSYGAKAAASHPPRELHQVGDHTTAYNPPDPATYPAGSKTYKIQRGDTLWNLAQKLYNNVYLWPQLWESNTWITDSHWIYPGDVLLVQGEVMQQAAAGTTAGAAGQGTQTLSGGPAAQAQNAVPPPSQPGGIQGTASPIPLGTEADIFCFGYLGDPREPMPNSVGSYEDVEMRYDVGALLQQIGGSETDLVYINGGTSTGVVANETYLLVRPGDSVLHPVTKAVIGRHYDFVGQVKIIRADEKRACAIISQSCDSIHIGDKLKPMPQLPIPLARVPDVPAFCEPRSAKAQGFIVNAQGGWSDALAEGILVEINLGKDDQVWPGDFLTVWRESPQPGQPPQVLGEVGVLTSESHTATAKIVAHRYAMRVGDHVELR